MPKQEVDPVAKMRVGRLVNKLGGPSAVERYIGATENSVKMWRINGRVPLRWRTSVLAMASAESIDLLRVELDLLELR